MILNVANVSPKLKLVAWKSPKGQGADEWEETEVTFDLSTDEKRAFIQFRHTARYRSPAVRTDKKAQIKGLLS